MDGSKEVVLRQDQLEEIPTEQGTAPGREGGSIQKAPGLPLLPAEDRPCKLKSRRSAQCWCERRNTKQTREHLFKSARHGGISRTLWIAVREATNRGKDRLQISQLFADERCSEAVLGFLATTDVGRTVPPAEEGEGPQFTTFPED